MVINQRRNRKREQIHCKIHLVVSRFFNSSCNSTIWSTLLPERSPRQFLKQPKYCFAIPLLLRTSSVSLIQFNQFLQINKSNIYLCSTRYIPVSPFLFYVSFNAISGILSVPDNLLPTCPSRAPSPDPLIHSYPSLGPHHCCSAERTGNFVLHISWIDPIRRSMDPDQELWNPCHSADQKSNNFFPKFDWLVG